MLKGETDELAALVAQQRVVREATIDVNALAAKRPVTERNCQLLRTKQKQFHDARTIPRELHQAGCRNDAATG